MKDRELYERCWGCHGTRKTTTVFNADTSRELPAGSDCPLCDDGYQRIGVTWQDVQAAGEKHRATARERDEYLAALKRLAPNDDTQGYLRFLGFPNASQENSTHAE